jgi:hypothetical protein
MSSDCHRSRSDPRTGCGRGRTVAPLVAVLLLLQACAPAPPLGPPGDGLSDRAFWRMFVEFSEPAGWFPSDNLISNESDFQMVVPALSRRVAAGRAYLGVGPDQNFTYIVAVRPSVAFVIDVRRENALLHLLYKALLETSADRAQFLSRLFARPLAGPVPPDAPPQALFDALAAVAASPPG